VEILATGRPGLQEDLAAALQGRLSSEQVKALVEAVPLEGVATMQRQWLPNVVEEVEARRAGAPLPGTEPDSEPALADTTGVAPKLGDVAADDLHNSRLLDSGWQLHSPSLSLRYQPTRHADPLVTTLLELSVLGLGEVNASATNAADGESAAAALVELYESLASPFAEGRCTKCHTVDNHTSGDAHLNWLTYRPPLSQHAFTRFNHAPHVTLQTNEACSRCHSLSWDNAEDRRAIFRSEFVAKDWQPVTTAHDFSSDFSHMSKSNCAECHTKKLARDRCTTCHNYHVR